MHTITSVLRGLADIAAKTTPAEDFRHNVYGWPRLILNIFYMFWYLVFVLIHLILLGVALFIFAICCFVEVLLDGVFE